LTDRFSRLFEAFGHGEFHPQLSAWFVPGRVEVLGKHTDYAGGRSLVCAADRGIAIVTRPRSDSRVRIADVARQSIFDADLTSVRHSHADDWFVYPSTVIRRVTLNFPPAKRGFDAAFDSDLPSAGGLSSSSALIIAILLAMASSNDLEATDVWRADLRTCEGLAGYAAAVENGQNFGRLAGEHGVGTSGGSEDHVAILCGRRDELLQYAFDPIRCEDRVPMPSHMTFAVGVSGVHAIKTGNAMAQYNRAARLARRGLEHWNRQTGRSDSSLAVAISACTAPMVRDVLHGAHDPEFTAHELRQRFDQFVEESEHLVPAAARQLRADDTRGFAETVARSQQLARDVLGNQVEETSALVTIALATGALAASAFGAGFGGSVWALVHADDASRFLTRWGNGYHREYPGRVDGSSFFLTRPGPAACEVKAP
jgi:galactokinase